MDEFYKNAFSSICCLWKEFFSFKKLKRMPVWVLIVLTILAAPLTLAALAYTGVYFIAYFFYLVLYQPIRFLHQLIKNEGKEVHFMAQFAMYLVCFPIVFLLYIILAIIIPFLFISYFVVSCLTYCSSFGGMKFNAFYYKDVDRSLTPREPRVHMAIYLPFTIKALVDVVCGVLFSLVGTSASYSNPDGFLGTFLIISGSVGLFSYIFDVLFGCVYFNEKFINCCANMKKNSGNDDSNKVEIVEEKKVTVKETKAESVKNEKVLTQSTKDKKKLSVIELVFSFVLVALVAIGIDFLFDVRCFKVDATKFSFDSFTPGQPILGIAIVLSLLCLVLVIVGCFTKIKVMRIIGNAVNTASSLVLMILVILTFTNFTNLVISSTNSYAWTIYGESFITAGIFGVILGLSIANLIISIVKKERLIEK